MTGDGAAQDWLTARVDTAGAEALRRLVDSLCQLLATAVGDAVALRRVAADGSLVPLAAHHPDQGRADSMRAVMARTEDSSEGLWAPVVRDLATVRWSAERSPTAPSPEQSTFIDAWSVQAVVGVPLLVGGRAVGGVALVRFGVPRDFGPEDEALLVSLAERLAPVVELLRVFDPV